MPQILPGSFAGNLPATAALSWGTDLFLRRDAPNTLALRNGANAQTLNVYGSFTDSSNYERLTLGYDAGNTAFLVSGNVAGTGTHRNLELSGGGNVLGLGMAASSQVNWTINGGHLLAGTDNSYDIGASGANRPRNLYVAGYLATGAPVTVAGTSYTVGTTDSSLIFTSGSTVTVTLPAAASFPGRRLLVKDTGAAAVNSASSNVVPQGSTTPGTTILAAVAGKWAELQSDGVNWVIMSSN